MGAQLFLILWPAFTCLARHLWEGCYIEVSEAGEQASHKRISSSAGTGSSILSALQDIFSVTWLNRSKVEKQLQVISVLQWVLSFLVLGKLP